MHVHVEAKGVGYPRAGAIESYELLDVDAGK